MSGLHCSQTGPKAADSRLFCTAMVMMLKLDAEVCFVWWTGQNHTLPPQVVTDDLGTHWFPLRQTLVPSQHCCGNKNSYSVHKSIDAPADAASHCWVVLRATLAWGPGRLCMYKSIKTATRKCSACHQLRTAPYCCKRLHEAT